jgi:hypothetical protein
LEEVILVLPGLQPFWDIDRGDADLCLVDCPRLARLVVDGSPELEERLVRRLIDADHPEWQWVADARFRSPPRADITVTLATGNTVTFSRAQLRVFIAPTQ